MSMNQLTTFTILLCFSRAIYGQLPPYVNCTRYLEPCVVMNSETCCGYPIYDCISDGREALCQAVSDFPELSAELMLRLREAKDRGDPEAKEIQKDVYDLLGTTRKPGGGRGNPTTRGTTRRTTTPRRTTRTTPRRTTTRRSSNN